MLNAQLVDQLKAYLQHIKNNIVLSLALDNSAKSLELKQLAEQLDTLSSKISIQTNDTPDARVPSMTLSNEQGNQVAFAGIPLGHEFTSLVLALLHIGGHPTKVEADIAEQIKNLEGTFHFETYISLSCQNCPDVVQALNMMAAINPNIRHTMVDGALFQDEVDAKNIMAVPTVMLNDEVFSQGRISLTDIVSKIDTNAAKTQAKKLNAKKPYDVLIVGGGPAGASAAVYAARKGIRTGLVADKFGGQVMDTVGIENFISVKATEGPKLVASLEEHVKDYDVDIMTGQRATAVSQNGNIEVELENGAKLQSKSIILATGARWRQMNVPGETEYKGKGVAYCPHCDGPLFKQKM